MPFIDSDRVALAVCHASPPHLPLFQNEINKERGKKRTSEHQSEEYTCSCGPCWWCHHPPLSISREDCSVLHRVSWHGGVRQTNRLGNIYLTYGRPTHCCWASLAHSLTIPCWFLSQHKSCVIKKTGSSCSLRSGSISPLCGTLSEAAQITHSECFVGVVSWADDLADSQLSWLAERSQIQLQHCVVIRTTSRSHAPLFWLRRFSSYDNVVIRGSACFDESSSPLSPQDIPHLWLKANKHPSS